MILTKEMIEFVKRVKANYKPNVRDYSKVIRVEGGHLLYTDGFTAIKSNTGIGVPADVAQCLDLNGRSVEFTTKYPGVDSIFSTEGKVVTTLREDLLSAVAATLSTKEAKPRHRPDVIPLSLHQSFVRFVDQEEFRLEGELIRINPLSLAKAFAVIGGFDFAAVIGGDLLKLDGRYGTAIVGGIQPKEA